MLKKLSSSSVRLINGEAHLVSRLCKAHAGVHPQQLRFEIVSKSCSFAFLCPNVILWNLLTGAGRGFSVRELLVSWQLIGWYCISPPQAAVPPSKQPPSLASPNPPMSKGSEQGFQSPPASSSSVTINTAPFQAMQTVSMECRRSPFIIPVKKPLFLLHLILGTMWKNSPFLLLLFGLVEFAFVQWKYCWWWKNTKSKASRLLNGYFIRAFSPLKISSKQSWESMLKKGKCGWKT